jgi:hypothetical protein
MLGRDARELAGRKIWSFLQDRPSDAVLVQECCAIDGTLRDGLTRHADNEVFSRSDGTQFNVQYTVTPIIENGEVHGATILFRDVVSYLLPQASRHNDLSAGKKSEFDSMRRVHSESMAEISRLTHTVPPVSDSHAGTATTDFAVLQAYLAKMAALLESRAAIEQNCSDDNSMEKGT